MAVSRDGASHHAVRMHMTPVAVLLDRSHYPTCPAAYLEWASHRRRNVLEELQHWDADIICVQEVDAGALWLDLQAALDSMGYSGEHKKRSGDKVWTVLAHAHTDSAPAVANSQQLRV
jgi:mRNA deadenylase 3'-5' endonuclease subunit Ccr4